MKITKSRNFRDLTAAGAPGQQSIRTGMLLRSAHLDNLDNDEKREIHSLGIKTIIDFRRTEEQLTPIPEGLEHVSMVHIPIGDVKHDDKKIKKTPNGKVDLGSLMAANEMIDIDQLWIKTCDRYEEKIIKYRDELVQAVSVCTDIKRLPVLFHCVGGKDRTGILGACRT
ncbi:tyrosine-protein phosphatase [Endozoicomonas arenosclerae]|uniref:tyrosine-protein phosphatase n=1 Tax=Endozoicomonas arenosclerae TaxID=1633495 RepID=UPI000785CBE4|nr:tyrosine-protein phosphatase [Endozoicomonas arenosclerae]